MEIKKTIELAIAYAGTNNARTARNLNWSPQNFSKRLRTGKFSVEELNDIAVALGAEKAEIHIYFSDGKII